MSRPPEPKTTLSSVLSSKSSTTDVLESFSRGVVDLAGVYAVCRALASPTWLVVDPEGLPTDIPGTTDVYRLLPLDVGKGVSHIVIPVLHGQGNWTVAISALQEKRITSFQPGNRDDLHARSFEIARRLCSGMQEADDVASWLEERCVSCYSSPSTKDEGIYAIVHVLDRLLGNPPREEIVVSAWRYALGMAYAATQRVSASVAMPLAYNSHVCIHAKEAWKIVQEQTERLGQIQRYLLQVEANRDACLTLHGHLDAILQRDESCNMGRDTMASVHGSDTPTPSCLLMELDEALPSNKRRYMLETVRSALRNAQEDCETFILMFSERHGVQMDVINESTKRRRAT